MDGFDLFRKLGVGTKFDFKRFKSDANVLNVSKAHNNILCSVNLFPSSECTLKNFSVDQINNQFFLAFQLLPAAAVPKSATKKARLDADNEQQDSGRVNRFLLLLFRVMCSPYKKRMQTHKCVLLSSDDFIQYLKFTNLHIPNLWFFIRQWRARSTRRKSWN